MKRSDGRYGKQARRVTPEHARAQCHAVHESAPERMRTEALIPHRIRNATRKFGQPRSRPPCRKHVEFFRNHGGSFRKMFGRYTAGQFNLESNESRAGYRDWA